MFHFKTYKVILFLEDYSEFLKYQSERPCFFNRLHNIFIYFITNGFSLAFAMFYESCFLFVCLVLFFSALPFP